MGYERVEAFDPLRHASRRNSVNFVNNVNEFAAVDIGLVGLTIAFGRF
jgi:hypothetical protein